MILKISPNHYFFYRLIYFFYSFIQQTINDYKPRVNPDALEGWARPAPHVASLFFLLLPILLSVRMKITNSIVITTSWTLPWWFVRKIFRYIWQVHDDDRKTFEMMTTTSPLGILIGWAHMYDIYLLVTLVTMWTVKNEERTRLWLRTTEHYHGDLWLIYSTAVY